MHLYVLQVIVIMYVSLGIFPRRRWADLQRITILSYACTMSLASLAQPARWIGACAQGALSTVWSV